VNTPTLDQLRAANLEAARALQAGAQIADRAISRGDALPSPDNASFGALLASPSAFWATATVDGTHGGDVVAAIVQANRLAAARTAVGDMAHIREGLLGQATWLSVQAVKFATMADRCEANADRAIAFHKLALMAQRQAAQTLASVATLNKIGEATMLSVID